jgi:hypothetical protein
MSLREVAQTALQSLKEQIETEKNPQDLRELVLQINVLLDLIEKQVEKLEEGRSDTVN